MTRARFWFGLSLLLLIVLVPAVATAQTEQAQFQTTLQVSVPGLPCDGRDAQGRCLNTVDENLFSRYLAAFFNYFYGVAGILAATMMVIGGFRWITAAGNASKVSQGKEMIQSAVIGLILILTSFVLLRAINPDLVRLRIQPAGVINQSLQPDSSFCNPSLAEIGEARCGTVVRYVDGNGARRECISAQCNQPATAFNPDGRTLNADGNVCVLTLRGINPGYGCKPLREACAQEDKNACAVVNDAMRFQRHPFRTGTNNIYSCQKEVVNLLSDRCVLASALTCLDSVREQRVTCNVGGGSNTECWNNGQPTRVTPAGRDPISCSDEPIVASGFGTICCAANTRNLTVCDTRAPAGYVQVDCSTIRSDGFNFRDADGNSTGSTTCSAPNNCYVEVNMYQ